MYVQQWVHRLTQHLWYEREQPNPLLVPFGKAYAQGVGLVREAYETGRIASRGLPVPVIVIGNIIGAGANAAIQSMVSNAADPSAQGQTMGSVASLNSLTAVLAPLPVEVVAEAVGRPGRDAGAEEVVVVGPDRPTDRHRTRDDGPVVGVAERSFACDRLERAVGRLEQDRYRTTDGAETGAGYLDDGRPVETVVCDERSDATGYLHHRLLPHVLGEEQLEVLVVEEFPPRRPEHLTDEHARVDDQSHQRKRYSGTISRTSSSSSMPVWASTFSITSPNVSSAARRAARSFGTMGM